MRRAALFLGLGALAYAVSSLVLALAGYVPIAPVISGLDVDNYYAWQIVFILPLVPAVWVLSSGVLLALGTRGCHRSDVLDKASRAWGGPLLLAWVPSAVEAFFAALGMGQTEWVDILSRPGFWQAAYLGFYAAAAAWAVVGFVRTARSIHKKSWPAAILTGLAATVVAAGIFALFVR
ncbi:MAG TPA: hypothetical protein VLJ16_13915, partial [Acidobacteriota bacterium]|nr:hypothetical protein [Acidobacteriota bacterium]